MYATFLYKFLKINFSFYQEKKNYKNLFLFTKKKKKLKCKDLREPMYQNYG